MRSRTFRTGRPQRGLASGLLSSTSLRTVDFQVGCGSGDGGDGGGGGDGGDGAPAQTVRALLDTGSQTTAISREAAAHCGLLALCDESFARTVGGIGGAAAGRSHGRVHFAKISIGGAELEV